MTQPPEDCTRLDSAPEPASGQRSRVLLDLALVTCVVLLVAVPFLNKAFHLDDWVYLRGAERVLERGMGAYEGTVGFLGREHHYYSVTHPPVYFLMVAGVIRLVGGPSEVALHVLAACCLFACGVAGYFLGRRFRVPPLAVALLLVSCPALVVSTQSVMTDVPMLAFFLLAVTFHVFGVDRDSPWRLILAVTFTILALATSYQAMFLALLLPLYNFGQRKWAIRHILPALIVPVILIGWSAVTLAMYGAPHLVAAFFGPGSEHCRNLTALASKLTANTVVLGATLVFPFILLGVYWWSPLTRKDVGLASSVAVLITVGWWGGLPIGQKLLFLAFLTTGLTVLLRAVVRIYEAWRSGDKDQVFLGSWGLLFFLAAVVLLPCGIARYLLPALLPLVIFVLMDLRQLLPSAFRMVTILVIVSTLGTSLVIAWADKQRVETYRAFVRNVAATYGSHHVWLSGEGGLRWYGEQQGFDYLMENDQRPHSSDVIIFGQFAGTTNLPELRERCRLLDRIPIAGRVPIRTMNSEAGADFYSQNLGILPYAYSTAVLETFEVYEVVADPTSPATPLPNAVPGETGALSAATSALPGATVSAPASTFAPLILELHAAGFWTLTYLLLIRRGFRDRTCGMPIIALCLNFSNELVSTFFFPAGETFQVLVYASWLLLDAIIFWQFLRFWQADPIPNLPRKLFYPTMLLTLAMTFWLTLMAFHEFDDVRRLAPPYGCLFAGYGAALVMSVLFLAMLFRREGVGGQSLYIGLFKMLGTLAYSVEYVPFMRSSPLIFSMMAIVTVNDVLYVILFLAKCRRLGLNPWTRV